MSIHTEGKVYKVRWREGKRQRSRTFYTRRDAETYELERKRRKSLGAVSITSGEQDFNTFVDEWWEAHKTTLAPSTQQLYEGTLDRYIRPFFSSCRMHDITIRGVKQFRYAMEKEGVGIPTQAKALSVLSAVCSGAVEDEKLLANPVLMVKKPTMGRSKKVEPFPAEKVEALRAKFETLEERTFISALYMTGGRPAEIYAGLEWKDIGNDYLLLHGEKTRKRGRYSRQIRYLRPLQDDLTAWKMESGRMLGQVFGWSLSRYRNWARKHFKPKAIELGISPEDARPRSLRKAFVTILAKEGWTISYIAEQLGDRPTTVEEHYLHLIRDAGEPIDAVEQIRQARIGIPSAFPQDRPQPYLGWGI